MNLTRSQHLNKTKHLSFSDEAGNTMQKLIQSTITKCIDCSYFSAVKNIFMLTYLVFSSATSATYLEQHSRSSFNTCIVSTVSRRRPDKRPKLTQLVSFDTKKWHSSPESPSLFLTVPAKLISRGSPWCLQHRPSGSLPPQHLITDKGHGIKSDLQLKAQLFASAAVVQHLHCHRPSPEYPVHLPLCLPVTQKSARSSHRLVQLSSLTVVTTYRCHWNAVQL